MGLLRPRVIINCAVSLDGKLALGTWRQTRLSSEEDMARVHRLRNSVDAIMVGIGTVLSDDPKLTVKEKYVENPRNPTRVVVDSRLRIPRDAQVLNGAAPTIVATTEEAEGTVPNAEVIRCGRGKVDLSLLLELLRERGIRSVMVEGGSRLIGSLLRQGLFDELKVYVAPVVIGDGAPTLAGFPAAKSHEETVKLILTNVERLGEGVLMEFVPAGKV